MSQDTNVKIAEAKSALAEEKSKDVPNLAVIELLQNEIIEAERAYRIEIAAQSERSSSRHSSPDEKGQEAQIETAVASSRIFLEKEKVVQVRNVAAALSDETGQTVVTKADIDTMKQNATMVVTDPVNQKEHTHRQEQARALKEQLQDPTLSAEERNRKEAQRETIIEAIGGFKEAETVTRKTDLMAAIAGKNPQAALKKSNLSETTTEQPTLTAEQEKALKREAFLLNNALDKGEIGQADFEQRMKDLSLNVPSALTESREIAAVMSALSEAGMKGGVDVAKASSSSKTPAQPVVTGKSIA